MRIKQFPDFVQRAVGCKSDVCWIYRERDERNGALTAEVGAEKYGPYVILRFCIDRKIFRRQHASERNEI